MDPSETGWIRAKKGARWAIRVLEGALLVAALAGLPSSLVAGWGWLSSLNQDELRWVFVAAAISIFVVTESLWGTFRGIRRLKKARNSENPLREAKRRLRELAAEASRRLREVYGNYEPEIDENPTVEAMRWRQEACFWTAAGRPISASGQRTGR